jgi:hypothetical protein
MRSYFAAATNIEETNCLEELNLVVSEQCPSRTVRASVFVNDMINSSFERAFAPAVLRTMNAHAMQMKAVIKGECVHLIRVGTNWQSRYSEKQMRREIAFLVRSLDTWKMLQCGG